MPFEKWESRSCLRSRSCRRSTQKLMEERKKKMLSQCTGVPVRKMRELLTAKEMWIGCRKMEVEQDVEKEKTTASDKAGPGQVDVRRTRSHRMKFCVQGGWGAALNKQAERKKSRRILLCGSIGVY